MILTHNKDLIKKTLGKQGSSQCGVYAIAYGFTILEGKCRVSGSPASHTSVANAYNPKAFAACYWSSDGLTSRTGSSVQGRYGKIIDELNKGRPVVVAVQGSSANHYILVIGVKDGKTASTVKDSDFYIIDPADCKFGYFGSTWAHGFNKSSYGLQYCTFNKGSVGKSGSAGAADHPKSWYTNKYGNEAKVYFWMRDLGYSHKGTCAIMGNIAQESNFNTSVTSRDGYGSKGMCQWTGGRLTNLKNFAKEKGLEWTSVECQCRFLDKELKSYKKLHSNLVSGSGKLYDLTYDFCFTFERPAKAYANMQNRSSKASTYNTRYANAYGASGAIGEEYAEGAQAAVDMQKRSSQLYSSDLYTWKSDEDESKESEENRKSREKTKAMKNYLSNIQVSSPESPESLAVPEYITISPSNKKSKLIKSASSVLPIAEAMVECPFVELDLKGTVVGTLKNSVDDYPNHISSLEVEKINGQIHKYSINIIHQIRPGEDPNLFDRILSKARYDRISLKYGDYASNVIYGDEKIFITDVVMNRDYVSSRISYTIHATSAGSLITSYKLNFPAQNKKPSTVINDMLYNNKETSELLLDAFPGMKNKSIVSSQNLIPSDDSYLELDEKLNISPIEYINYLVSCMSNMSNSKDSTIRDSSYYITYENDYDNKMGGAYFNISEVKPNSVISTYGNNIYEITVGYPDNNFVMEFSVDNQSAWALFYKNSSLASEYIYSIDKDGNRVKQYSPNLMSASNPFNEIQKNWWTSMVHFPINASVTLKGLIKPIMLMDYVIVNVVFYGQKHITSGAYVITGQRDTLSGTGFRSTLALTRVGAN